jgi:hypothetical protein
VKAADNLVLILLDLTDRSAYPDERKKYNVTGLPSILFLDPDGKVVGKLGDRSPQGVVREFSALYEKHARVVPWAESVEKGLETAASEKKPVLLLFTEADDDESKRTEGYFYDKSMADLNAKFVLIRHPVEKKCDVCKRFRAKAGKIQILDPTAEDPAKRPLYRVSGKKKLADFMKALETALKKWEKSQGV